MKKKIYAILAAMVLMSLSWTSAFAGNDTGSDPTIKIVGGQNADIKNYPYQVALFSTDDEGNISEQMCGGSIIDRYWILTAAHCVLENAHKKQKIVASISNLSLASQGQIIEISDYIIHPNYDPEGIRNDIALLRLSLPIDTSRIDSKVISLVTPQMEAGGMIDSGVMATITGWGTTQYMGNSPDRLQVGELPLISVETANAWFMESVPGEANEVSEGMLPAGFEQGGVSGCHGDSGGPLAVKDNTNTLMLAGITSWGNVCGAPKQPAVYTRVPYYYDWIMENSNIGNTEEPTIANYLEFLKLNVPESVSSCGNVISFGDILIRNFGTNNLTSFDISVKVGNSPDDILFTENKTIQLSSPLPPLGTKRVDIPSFELVDYKRYYIEVVVSKPNGQDVEIELNEANTYFDFIEPTEFDLKLTLGDIQMASAVIFTAESFEQVYQKSYSSDDSNKEFNEKVCLPEGQYMLSLNSWGDMQYNFSTVYQDKTYNLFYNTESQFMPFFSFTVPFEPKDDLAIVPFFAQSGDTSFVCDIEDFQDDFRFEIRNSGTIPASNVKYRVIYNDEVSGTNKDVIYEGVIFANNSASIDLDNTKLVYGRNKIEIHILTFNEEAIDLNPEDNVYEKTFYIQQVPKFAELELKADEEYYDYSWRIVNEDGFTIKSQGFTSSNPYTVDLCLDYGCYTFIPDSWGGEGIAVDTAVIMRGTAGNIIFAIKGEDFRFSNQVDFCNTPSSVKDNFASDAVAFPNPTSSNIFFKVNSQVNANAEMQICDLLGNKLMTKQVNLNYGENILNYDVSKMHNGIYLLRLVANNQVISKRFTVVK